MTQQDDGDASTVGLMRRAAAYEAKYVELDADGNPLRITVPILEVGVHPKNRGGVYTQGRHCKRLIAAMIWNSFEHSQNNFLLPKKLREHQFGELKPCCGHK